MPAPLRTRRLNSLNKSSLGPRTRPVQRPAAPKHNCCPNPKVEDTDDGQKVCRNCYTLVDSSNIVADVTFQEDSRGAATVQGGFIGDNARHARTLGSAVTRRVGGEGKNRMQEIESTGRRAMHALCPRLGIPDSVLNQAVQLYLLVSDRNFSAGRRTDEVVAACLYAACRRQKENQVLLIDIAELQKLNVFRLGEVYKTMCKELYLDQHAGNVGTQYLVEVESLVMKYCRKLEFGDQTRQVAEDAVKIVRRMKRDWMVTGRHPAGLCGACIILAARMNNFRRSVREVVYVSKVADITIAKRVEEFRRTKAAALTVDQFREYGFRLKHTHDPPVLYESELKKQKLEEKKRQRQAMSQMRDTIEISDNGSNASSRATSVVTATPTPALDQDGDAEPPRKRLRTASGQPPTPAPTQQEPRRDADGFLIPALPIDPAILESEQAQPEKRGPGRPKKVPPAPIVISEEELADEAELEAEIEHVLNDEIPEDTRTEIQVAKDEENAKALAEQQMKYAAEESKARREAEGINWWQRTTPAPAFPAQDSGAAIELVTAEDLEAEFADDPEVMNCRLTPEEQQVKERIWVMHNEDWLRAQQEKKLLADVHNATKGDKAKQPKKRKKKGRMGDNSSITEATTPIESAADASAAMLAKHAPAKFSKFINYDALDRVFGAGRSPSSNSSPNGTRNSSATPGADAQRRERATPVANSAQGEGRQIGSASPSPAAARATTVRIQTPPATQHVVRDASASPSPAARRTRDAAARPPATPPQTQTQTQAEPSPGAEDDESEGDEGDYIASNELDYGSEDERAGRAWDEQEMESDREDIGEDDFSRALDPTRGVAEDTFGEEFY